MTIIFVKFVMDNALFRIVEFLLTANKQDGVYEKYMVPGIDDESHRLMYNRVQRTVTENHGYKVYASPDCESFIQCEGEYHTVKHQ